MKIRQGWGDIMPPKEDLVVRGRAKSRPWMGPKNVYGGVPLEELGPALARVLTPKERDEPSSIPRQFWEAPTPRLPEAKRGA